jgi:hypothetical protein
MTCFSTRRHSTAYIDGRLRDRERARMAAHLRSCDTCASHVDQLTALRSGLQSLSPVKAPSDLSSKLRVIASRERHLLVQTEGSRFRRMWDLWKLRLDDLMRPLTIPAAGGILSSLIMFGVLSATISESTRGVGYDIPVIYQDRTDANLVPLDVRNPLTLTMSLDDKGRIRDYAVQDASASFSGNPSRLTYNTIVLPEFPSVLTFSHPVSSDNKIQLTPISFRY